MEKKKIKTRLHTWSIYKIEGELTEVISLLQKIITDNPDYFDFAIETYSESGYYGDSNTYISIDASRWETDKELLERIAAENDRKRLKKIQGKIDAEEREKKERQMYESLKRKFESEINNSTK